MKFKENFKKFVKRIGKVLPIAAIVSGCLLLVHAIPVMAGGSLNSLQITNCLQGTNTYTSYPTNTFNPTNGIPQLTGRPVFIGNVEHFGICFQGWLQNTNAAATSSVTFTFATSMAGGPAQMTLGTNTYSQNYTNILTSDWSYTNNLFTVVVPLPPLTTNWYNWQTNIVSSTSGGWGGPDANWIGVYQIITSVPVGDVLTNTTLGVNTKLIPHPTIPL